MKNVILFLAIIFTFNMANAQTKKKKTNNNQSVKYTEEKALELIADYYEFYNADEKYDNPVVRRISNNVFYVKVQYCLGGDQVCFEGEAWDTTLENGTVVTTREKKEFFWNSKVLVLKIQSSTKYTVTEKEDF